MFLFGKRIMKKVASHILVLTTEKIVEVAMRSAGKDWGVSATQSFTLQTRMLKLRGRKKLAHSHLSLGMAQVRTQSSELPLQILSTISYDE